MCPPSAPKKVEWRAKESLVAGVENLYQERALIVRSKIKVLS